MKYIIFDDQGLELPIVFPERIAHRSMKNAMNSYPVISAGFCRFHYDRESEAVIASCWGESVSLGVKSRKEDGGILSKVNEDY